MPRRSVNVGRTSCQIPGRRLLLRSLCVFSYRNIIDYQRIEVYSFVLIEVSTRQTIIFHFSHTKENVSEVNLPQKRYNE